MHIILIDRACNRIIHDFKFIFNLYLLFLFNMTSPFFTCAYLYDALAAILSSDPTRRYVDGDVSSTSEDATPRPLAPLLWRRGLALALMVAIFGAGLACRLFAPRPAGRAASLVDWNVANSSSPPLAINYTTTISS